MTNYLDLAKRVQALAKEEVKAKEAFGDEQPSASTLSPVVDIRTIRPVQRDPDERRLLAAGWTPKDRRGPKELSIWANPESGFYYSQEVALHCLDQRSGA